MTGDTPRPDASPPGDASGPAAPQATSDTTAPGNGHGSHGLAAKGKLGLVIGAIGVVFGDIGTSPLYAMREALSHSRSGGEAELAVLGTVSLVFWALILVVTVKYVVFLMRADNKGEGGSLALMALAQHAIGKRSALVFFLGICGAAMFYGDGVLTPAVSVLSAVEGLGQAPGIGRNLMPFVVPIAAGILVSLFMVQSRGTASMASSLSVEIIGMIMRPITSPALKALKTIISGNIFCSCGERNVRAKKP